MLALLTTAICDCALEFVKSKWKSFRSPSNTLCSLKHEDAWRAVIKSLGALGPPTCIHCPHSGLQGWLQHLLQLDCVGVVQVFGGH